jgi:hypothetical protein
MSFSQFRPLLFIASILLLSACITLPGHRQTIDEDGFYLQITAPSKSFKDSIRFNSAETDIAYLPLSTKIKLVVMNEQGKHEVNVINSNGAIGYLYTLNGRAENFGVAEQKWFSSQIPKIIDRAGL